MNTFDAVLLFSILMITGSVAALIFLWLCARRRIIDIAGDDLSDAGGGNGNL